MTSAPAPLLVFRADASAALGSGHVMRCLALAQAWVDAGGCALLVAAALPGALADRLTGEGVALLPVRARAGSAADADGLAAVAAASAAAWVVVDGYAFDGAYEARVREAGVPLVALEDDGRVARHAADVVLNQNLHADAAEMARRAPAARVLAGPRYALLRREFRRAPRPRGPHRREPGCANRLLVTLGGGDARGAAAAVLAAVPALRQPPRRVRVLAGGAGGAALDAAARAAGPPRIAVVADAADVARHMRWADLAVAGGGSTCWELARCGVAAVVVVVAENQRPIARSLDAAGVVRYAVDHDPARPAATAAAVGAALDALVGDPDLRAAMAERGRALVDGRGAARVARALRALGAAAGAAPDVPDGVRAAPSLALA